MARKWRFKLTVKGKWATITIETNHWKLGNIIQDAYDNAVSDLNNEERPPDATGREAI